MKLKRKMESVSSQSSPAGVRIASPTSSARSSISLLVDNKTMTIEKVDVAMLSDVDRSKMSRLLARRDSDDDHMSQDDMRFGDMGNYEILMTTEAYQAISDIQALSKKVQAVKSQKSRRNETVVPEGTSRRSRPKIIFADTVRRETLRLKHRRHTSKRLSAKTCCHSLRKAVDTLVDETQLSNFSVSNVTALRLAWYGISGNMYLYLVYRSVTAAFFFFVSIYFLFNTEQPARQFDLSVWNFYMVSLTACLQLFVAIRFFYEGVMYLRKLSARDAWYLRTKWVMQQMSYNSSFLNMIFILSHLTQENKGQTYLMNKINPVVCTYCIIDLLMCSAPIRVNHWVFTALFYLFYYVVIFIARNTTSSYDDVQYITFQVRAYEISDQSIVSVIWFVMLILVYPPTMQLHLYMLFNLKEYIGGHLGRSWAIVQQKTWKSKNPTKKSNMNFGDKLINSKMPNYNERRPKFLLDQIPGLSFNRMPTITEEDSGSESGFAQDGQASDEMLEIGTGRSRKLSAKKVISFGSQTEAKQSDL